MTRRLAVFTGTRADYGLLRGLVRAIEASPDAELALLVSGSHLSERHGATIAEIEADGVTPAATIPVWGDDDSALGAARDLGGALPAYADALAAIDPDVVVVLGDRLEALALALAATIVGVPVAHIHGGEITEGAMDDSLRHAITKLATIHLTSTAEHRRRVIQLGEEPDRVHFVGAPVVDALAALPLLTAPELEERFGIRVRHPLAVVTYHPATLDVLPADDLAAELLAALAAVSDLHVVVTGSNTDIGSSRVRDLVADFVAAHPDRVDYVESFGQVGYLSLLALADVVAGNSSSTVLEAPVAGVRSVLVGDRQRGRPRAASVATPAPDRAAIADALRRAVAAGRVDPNAGPFGTPGFAERALAILLAADLPRPPRKRFHDLPGGERP